MTEENTTPNQSLLLTPGSLWAKVVQRTEHARQCGALESIETNYEFIEQDGIAFLVRTLANLVRKEKAKQKQQAQSKTGKKHNPFLPYEEDLFVTDISPTHLCLLNKFNVVEHHLLIVTRAFESQENLLNQQDFAALWTCMQEIDGLAFYNGGKTAGASQRHKHLQLVPLPFIPENYRLPIEPAIATAVFNHAWGSIPSFPFPHALAKLDLSNEVATASAQMLSCYHSLLKAVGLNVNQHDRQQPSAYNFLATRQWMLIVPRVKESFQAISINSLGFAGSLFVRNEEQKQLLEQIGPMTVLRNVVPNQQL